MVSVMAPTLDLAAARVPGVRRTTTRRCASVAGRSRCGVPRTRSGGGKMESWIFASSPNPSRAPPTTRCSASPRPPRTWASTPSSAPTTTCTWAPSTACPGPTDAWITLAGLARETKTIRLGTLMTAGTFRLPGVLAIEVAQVDAMSGGRVELGLGAGWYEEEHTAYGIPFPKEKFGRLEEQLAIVTGLWKTPVGETGSTSTGRTTSSRTRPALPKPAQEQGAGAHRRPRRQADAGAGGAVRRRVQHPVRLGRGHRDAVRPGAGRRRGARAAPPTTWSTPTPSSPVSAGRTPR